MISVFANEGKLGYGWVIRSSDGSRKVGSSGLISSYAHPFLAEVLSCHEALSWLKRANFSDVLLESDSLLLVQALSSSEDNSSSVGFIINDCKILCRDLNSFVSFVH